jgi:hypothetical protein
VNIEKIPAMYWIPVIILFFIISKIVVNPDPGGKRILWPKMMHGAKTFKNLQ